MKSKSNHIYLIQNAQSIRAEKMCNDRAQELGYKDWWDWHNIERKIGLGKDILKTESYLYSVKIEKEVLAQ